MAVLNLPLYYMTDKLKKGLKVSESVDKILKKYYYEDGYTFGRDALFKLL
mgnify:CR=1 FL=1